MQRIKNKLLADILSDFDVNDFFKTNWLALNLFCEHGWVCHEKKKENHRTHKATYVISESVHKRLLSLFLILKFFK